MIQRIIQLENTYMKNNYFGEKINDKTFKVCKGDIPILISAPHSVRQIRDNKIKAQDIMTGSIVDYIQEKTNCFSITNICFDNNDPNYDDVKKCFYKQEIIKIIKENNIKLIFDIHGLDLKKDSLIDICTNENSDLVDRLDILEFIVNNFHLNFKNYDKKVSLNKYYKADKEFCICNYISKNFCIPCVELELNKLLRNPYNENDFKFFVNKMIELIFFLDNII